MKWDSLKISFNSLSYGFTSFGINKLKKQNLLTNWFNLVLTFKKQVIAKNTADTYYAINLYLNGKCIEGKMLNIANIDLDKGNKGWTFYKSPASL